jgi:DNA-binding transcriptional ArsR family regulator
MPAPALAAVFGALADPTRLAIVERLLAANDEISAGEIAAPFAMSKPAITKHLKVLERAGLISRGREAQWRPCRISAGPLKQVSGWLESYRRFWDESYDRLDQYLSEVQSKETKHGPRRK